MELFGAPQVLERADPLVFEYLQLMLSHLRALEAENRDLHRRLEALAVPPSPKILPLPAERLEKLDPDVQHIIVEQAQRVATLEARVAQLEAETEQLRRAGKRQAAPFSRGKPGENPKRPGRKPGYEGQHRPVPPGPHEAIKLILERCPDCGGPVEDHKVEEQYLEDIPNICRPVRKYVIDTAHCPRCRKRVRPPADPQQLSTATGPCGVQLGPNVIGLAAELKHRHGITYRKITAILFSQFGLKVSPGGLVHAIKRLKERLKPIYDSILQAMRESSAVHADETGWRIGGLSAWLWVFANRHFTLYVIRGNRGHEVVLAVLQKAFQGVLVSDGLGSYEAKELNAFDKSKCIGHFLVDLSEAEAKNAAAGADAGVLRFVPKAKVLLQDALALRRAQPRLAAADYRDLVAWLELGVDVLLDVTYTHPDDIRLSNRLRRQRPFIFTFLYRGDVDGTNNLAERQIRPAVIARKLSAGNRTDTGAETHGVLASILATCAQQGVPFGQLVAWGLMRFTNLPRPHFALSPPVAEELLPRKEYRHFPLQPSPKSLPLPAAQPVSLSTDDDVHSDSVRPLTPSPASPQSLAPTLTPHLQEAVSRQNKVIPSPTTPVTVGPADKRFGKSNRRGRTTASSTALKSSDRPATAAPVVPNAKLKLAPGDPPRPDKTKGRRKDGGPIQVLVKSAIKALLAVRPAVVPPPRGP